VSVSYCIIAHAAAVVHGDALACAAPRDGDRTSAGDGVAPLAAVSWNLDRLDNRRLSQLDGRFTAAVNGSCVVYVLDTGVEQVHPEFGGRVSFGADLVGTTSGDAATDPHGHGTHAAGIIAGATTGVAPGATLVSVRVLDSAGRGLVSTLVQGVEFALQHAATHGRCAVIHSSCSAASAALQAAVVAAADRGVPVVVPAVAAATLREPGRLCGPSPVVPIKNAVLVLPSSSSSSSSVLLFSSL
jgi:subtilisin family serine protease